MSRLSRRRRHHRYAMPTDVHSSTEADELVIFALLLTLAVAALCLARIALASEVEPFSAFAAVGL